LKREEAQRRFLFEPGTASTAKIARRRDVLHVPGSNKKRRCASSRIKVDFVPHTYKVNDSRLRLDDADVGAITSPKQPGVGGGRWSSEPSGHLLTQTAVFPS